MPIPVGKLYQKKELGNGTVATVEDNTVDTVTAGADINFGAPVDIQNGKAVTATKAPIFGIAVKRSWIEGEHYYDLDKDHWYQGEQVGVLRKGGIQVPVSDDVNRYDQATVNADGTFKTVANGDQVVGRFTTDGNKGESATIQVNLTDMGVAQAGSASNTPAQTPTPSQSTNASNNSHASNNSQGGNK